MTAIKWVLIWPQQGNACWRVAWSWGAHDRMNTGSCYNCRYHTGAIGTRKLGTGIRKSTAFRTPAHALYKACLWVCVCVRMYLCMYVRMYVCMYVCMYVFVYVCMYACMDTRLTIVGTLTQRLGLVLLFRQHYGDQTRDINYVVVTWKTLLNKG